MASLPGQVRVNPAESIIALSGRFDFGSRKEFFLQCDVALSGVSKGPVVVNLSNVAYIDSSALGMLLLLRDKVNCAGRNLLLRGAVGNVAGVLRIANFDKLFTFE